MISENEVLNNYKSVSERLKKAADECGRDLSDILVIGASKVMPKERVDFVNTHTYIHVFGENRVQELLEKYDPNIEWHFIGQLQTNKVKYIIDKVSLIHSVDRMNLAEEISKQAAKRNKVQDFLIEVNMGAEISKGGVAPNDVIDFAREVTSLENIRLRGIMSVLPNVSGEELEKFYLQLRAVYDTLKLTELNNAEISYLSAGMSNDFDTAVKYGANIIRLGRAVFGER